MSLPASAYWNVTAPYNFVGDPNDFVPHPGASLAYHTDIFIIALVAVCVLFRLPRGLVRLTRASEWKDGHILRHTRPRRPRPRVRPGLRGGYPSSSSKELGSDDSHSSYSSSYLSHRMNGTRYSDSYEHSRSYPPHVSTCLSFLRPLVILFRTRLSPGFSLTQAFICVVYFAILAYMSFYKSSPFQDPVRAGFVAMSQYPVVFALATKNNLLGVLLGLGHEKLNFFHRFVGRLLVLAVNVHSIGYFYKWSAEGTFTDSLKKPMVTWGFVGLVCVDVLALFSTTFWRQRAYNVFLLSHYIAFSLLFVASWFHKSVMIPYIFAALGFYGLDRFLRLFKTRICRATIRPLPELNITRVEFPQLNAGWRAGQHVRLRVLSLGMGYLSWAEVHPFTIASPSGTQEGLVLMCKKTGTWTNCLYELAKIGGYSERGVQRDVMVTIEGPYGGPGHAIFASFSAAVFIVGGSGISFALAAIQELIQKDQEGASRVKSLELVWMVQDPASLVPLIPLFTTLTQQSDLAPLKIAIYYTRAPNLTFHNDLIHPSLSLAPGRPRFSNILEDVITRTVTLGNGEKDSLRHTGMLVATCGPVGLADDVAKAAGKVDPVRRDQVGGIELHEEVFGW